MRMVPPSMAISCTSTTPTAGEAAAVSTSKAERIMARVIAGLGILALLPEHVVAAGGAVEHPAQDEEQVGKAIEILAGCVVDRFRQGQGHQGPLGPPADGAGRSEEHTS